MQPPMVKKTVPLSEWTQKMSQTNLQKSDLNALVMNYLVIQGHKDAAQQFAAESQTVPGVPLESITDRMNIRLAVARGDIDQAIALTNDLDAEILDTHPALFFTLQRQKLIELIKSGDVIGAIAFATDELAKRGEEHPEFLCELEQAMSLLAFPDVQKSPVAELLDHSQRQRTAGELNSAILQAQSQEKQAKLKSMLKMLVWAQVLLANLDAAR